MKPSVAVIGGGIAGLVATYELMERVPRRFERGIDVRCYEATDRVGGNIRTTSEDGFLCEWGATGFLDNAPETITLIRRLGLEERSVKARDIAARRFIYRKGKLREVPLGPGTFLTSSILSPWGKLRLLGEPFVPGRQPRRDRERVRLCRATHRPGGGEYSGRRHGQRGVRRRLPTARARDDLSQDARAWSPITEACSARCWLERKTARKSGDAGGGPAGPGGRLISFRDGLQELIDTLTRAIGPRLCLESPIARITHMGARGFRLHPREGAPFEVDAVIVACPAWHAAALLQAMDPTLGQALDEIPSAAVAVVHLGYRRDALGPQPEGFGFLVPRGQGPRILGALWPSCMFEGRAPEGSRLFTVMIGGAHDPEGARLDDAKLLRLARADLQLTMGIHANPYFVRVIHHPRGIPQYEMGHRGRLQTIDSRLEETPGLWIAGNSLRGVAINACVAEAPGVAEAALEFLERRSSAAAI